MHSGDAQKSLASVSVLGSARQQLNQISARVLRIDGAAQVSQCIYCAFCSATGCK
jgi:hypothetical protein